MQIVILSPIADVLFTEQLKNKISSLGQLVIIKDIKPLSDVSELYSDAEKIVAIDPDFCDWKVSKEEVEKMKNVKVICLQTTSFSWIDTTVNIPVTNLRGFSTNAVAEWAIVMAFNVARKVPLIMKEGWKQDFVKYQGFELQGKTAGIIGLGHNGKRIAELCAVIGMNVMYWSENSRDDRFIYKELSEVMSADFVFPTVADNEQTRHLITDDMLRSMKPTSIFISTIHKIYNHDLVLQLVKEGKLYGYGFESNKENINDFEGNIWVDPELAWCTRECMKRNADQWTESIVKALQSEYPTRIN